MRVVWTADRRENVVKIRGGHGNLLTSRVGHGTACRTTNAEG